MTNALINQFTKEIIKEKQRKNGVTSNEIASTLFLSAISLAFVNESCKSSGKVSKSQVIYRKIQGKTKEELREFFRAKSLKCLRLLCIFSRNRKFIVSLDETDEAFYGDECKDPKYLHGGSIIRESSCYYQFLTAAITCDSIRYVIDAVILPKGAYKSDYVEEMVKFVKDALPLEAILFDRGFTDWETVSILKKLKVPYLVFWQKKGQWHKKYFNKMKDGEFKRILKKGDYKRNKTKYPVDSHFVLVKQLEYEGKKFDWIFATNLNLDTAGAYVKRYKKRWGIETLFRVTDDIRIYTTSYNSTLRHFLFLFTCLVYNIWKRVQSRIGKDFSLANFKINIIILLAKSGCIYPLHFDRFEQIMTSP
jgi:putative transposase